MAVGFPIESTATWRIGKGRRREANKEKVVAICGAGGGVPVGAKWGPLWSPDSPLVLVGNGSLATCHQ